MTVVWVHDPEDGRLKAAPRGDPGESIYTGGWRCAGAMGFHGFDVKDHVITVPFFVTNPDGDTRHCCYCAACARKFLGIEPPVEPAS
jgi:hypothetical protein